ncbi:aspartyl-phosphate phosphatase Spo0E family protein [Neobacillus cucumis]|uniref:aspartyl-phosphate phosphatase Spo0E family protein n=1 Tax=Neobacillus cucumis TaxID=1740721 RepID=UPI0018DF7E73|nr:aspartyl-phosphate phosphatase Spo0E family protein [Neobacillus cucumis]MBI0580583.1 aspartyl-phosphate phosphatase Spo0E family protein [Neobacillus cucumis]
MKPADLEMAIKKKRAEMIKLGMEKGLSFHETIKCSQELDMLLNDYNLILIETEQTNPMDVYHEFLIFLQKSIFRSLHIGYNSIFPVLQYGN